jgi:hypothetical protein
MEAMEALYADSNNTNNIVIELRDIIAVADMINQSGELKCVLPLEIKGRRVYFKEDNDSVEPNLHKVLLKIQYFTSKSLRFGASDVKPGSNKSNEQELEVLMMEYAYCIQALTRKNPAINYDAIYNADSIAVKQKKVLTNMIFAVKQGTLQIENDKNKVAINPLEALEMIRGLCNDEASLINNLFYRDEELGLKALTLGLNSLKAAGGEEMNLFNYIPISSDPFELEIPGKS